MKQQHDSLHKSGLISLGNPRVLTASALLTAVSLVLAYFAKSIFGTGVIRVTFESLPIFFGSMVFGPATGVVIAVATDLLSCLLSPVPMSPNPIITVGAALLGGISGTLYRYLPTATPLKVRVFLAVAVSHLIGSVGVKSVGLYLYFGWAVLWRIPVYAAIIAAETLLLQYLLANDALMRQIGKVTRT